MERVPEVVTGLGAERGALPSSGTGPEAISIEIGVVAEVAIFVRRCERPEVED